MKKVVFLLFFLLFACTNTVPYCKPDKPMEQVELDLKSCENSVKSVFTGIVDPYERGKEQGVLIMKCMFKDGYGIALFVGDKCYGYEK